MLKHILKIGRLSETRFSFGATAAIITNLSLITGLRTSEYAKVSIIAGMLVIAVADNISDSIGIHVYQESEGLAPKEVWLSTFTNFITRFLVSSIFILLVWFLPLQTAVVSSVIWGLFLLAVLSYAIAHDRGLKPHLAMLEHIAIAVVVIAASNYCGQLIISKFKL